MFGKWILCSVVVIASLSQNVSAQDGPAVGEASPNFMGRTMDDQLYRLANDTDRPKVISFFWTQCGHCKLELPELAKMEKKYPKVKFIAVHTKDESPETVKKFLRSLSASPSTVILTTGSLQEEFLYKGLPHTVVLDAENTVLANFSGYTPQNMKELNTLANSLNR